ncbi:MAG: NYN domain-containing protein [Bryobacteraceae bacterium]|jgi:uncharacterized protein (TIGR00288 family)|nr:NYN domain-containing protein [Bryobacteraceae bacterium]
MQEKLNIAVFVDYDNIEIGLKSTLRREFDVSIPLEALKERGDIVAKFAYANWGRQESAARQMAENAVQMVQRLPSPRGDKNGGDINLALDSLEMAFTHRHVNAFAIISGDSDFIPLVNKLKEYGKTVFIIGGKAFTSTILQQNCHEFISYESLLPDKPEPQYQSQSFSSSGGSSSIESLPGEVRTGGRRDRGDRPDRGGDRGERPPRQPRPPALDLVQAMPLVERALQVLERRGVQPQLGLLKSTMLQLDSTFSEKAYGAYSFSDFVEKMKKSELINVTGTGGRVIIERKGGAMAKPLPEPHEGLPALRDVLENHRLELENGGTVDELSGWMAQEHPSFDVKNYGFQQFAEFLNYAQDKTVVRIEQHEERGMIVFLGAEFYPPAAPPPPPEPETPEEEDDGPQPYVEGQPSIFEPNPPPPKPKKVASRKRSSGPKPTGPRTTRPRKRKTD